MYVCLPDIVFKKFENMKRVFYTWKKELVEHIIMNKIEHCYVKFNHIDDNIYASIGIINEDDMALLKLLISNINYKKISLLHSNIFVLKHEYTNKNVTIISYNGLFE